MKLTLLAFGIAKDILGDREIELDMDGEQQVTVAQLKNKLLTDYPAFGDLRSLAIAVNEEYREGDFQLAPADEIVIVPPVSGG